MMTFGAPSVMRTDTPRIHVRRSKIIFFQEPRTHCIALVYHGAAYVRSMGIEMRTATTCKRWLPR